MKNRRKRAIQKCLAFLLVFISCTMILPMEPQASEDNTITVAYIDYKNFLEQDSDGTYSGYAVDYLNKIAEYTGWNYEYVNMDWPTAYDAVKKSEIDFYCVARMTEGREDDFDFSLYPFCNEEMNLYTMKQSTICYEDFSHFNGLRIGMLKNSVEAEEFDSYASEKGFDYQAYEYDTNEEAAEALESGEVDAVALVNHSVENEYKIIGNFGVSPAYMMSCEGSSLMEEFSEAQEKLYFDNSSFSQDLENQYFNKNRSSDEIILTREEVDYIAGCNTLTVAVMPDMAPFEYLDRTTGEYKGITIDVYNRISEKTGLVFEFVTRDTINNPNANPVGENYQLTGAMVQSKAAEDAYQIVESVTFASTSFSIVAKDLSALNSDSIVAGSEEFPADENILHFFGYKNIVVYPGISDSLDAVASGEADLTYVFSICDNYLLGHAKYSSLQSMPLQGFDVSMCMGISNQCSPLLLSIINKGILSISDDEMNEIIVNNRVNAKPPQNFDDTLDKYRKVLIIITIIVLLGIMLIMFRDMKIKKQKILLEATKRQHDVLKHLYETMPCGIFQYSYEEPHNIIGCNTMAWEFYGYDSEQALLGKHPSVLVKKGTEEDFEKKFEQCEKNAGVLIRYVWTITKKDGSEAFVECMMDVVEADNRKIFQEIFIDITDRTLQEQQIERRYMEELRRNEKQAQGLLYTAYFDVDEQILIGTNIEMEGIAPGISMDQFVVLLNKELRGQQSEEQLTSLREHLSASHTEEAYKRGHYEHSFTVCRRYKDELQWLRSDLVLRRNPQNGHLMCFDYVWNITDQYVSDIVIRNLALVNCDGFMCIYCETKHCLQYQVMEDDTLVHSTAIYEIDDSLHRIEEVYHISEEKEMFQAITLDEVMKQLDEVETYRVYATLYDDEDKRIDKLLNYFYVDRTLGLIAVTVTDVTEVRSSEVRHAKLLSDALAAAEKADVAKGQFLSRVSHEMRTPLNAIIGFIELAKDADAEQTANCLASSDIAAKQLLAVINDVLDMSAIESGKMNIACTPFDFKRLMSSVTNIYGSQCKQKNLEFEVRLKSVTEDWLVGDELRVNQILLNLLGNAIKFTTKGHIWLTVSQTNVAEEKIFMRFEVSDTGCGMSEEMKTRLFRPFEQENATTARKYGGSGLGLSIVKNLVTMMGGSITVASEPDVGTTFTVDLPFIRSDMAKNEMSPEEVKQFRILSVDDEGMEREYIDMMLAGMGVRYTCVGSGEEALVELDKSMQEKDPYQVCLVDWRMPNMNGEETAKRIREKYGKDMVMIVVSSYDFNQMGEKAKAAGADVFLPKPIFPSTLFDLFMTLSNGKIAYQKKEPKAWNFAGKRVLLAEDNALNQIVAQGYLVKFNVALEIAENGQVALDMFNASEPGYYDAILMDIQMPVMDGFEATKAIRASKHPEAKTIYIIAQSADAFNEDIARALASGMNAHVAKPIKPDLLAQALAKVFCK